ncbi:mucin-2-like isoform X6 [Cydia strobilella]|uniref:mucin-2-like isoform X6 n=1 Tax=Cydia strobilella TaxID=1100964 RepID=UPI0030040ED1
MSRRAWVTLATNDSYGLGALVLAHSLRRVRSTHSTVVLITPSVTDAMRDRLRAVFTEVVTVDVLDSRDAAHLALLQRPELGITFTKIHCWGLTQYEKCVFLDADTLVVQNCDELFEREELSAAPDVGWPDCFNSGVFVYRPSTATFDALIKFAQERGSFDGGDQGLLNSFFSDWARGDINKHLPFLYNVTSAAFYSYLPALKHYGQDLKIIHFIGAAKPWLQPYNFETRSVSAPGHLQGLLQLWWDLFVGQVHHQLDTSMSGVAANLARVVPGAVAREALDELTRRQGWEAGNIDYMGADSFANIWAKISQTLNQPRASPPKEQPKQPSPPKEAAKQPSPLKEAPKQPSPPKEAPKQPSPPKEAPKQRSPPKEPAPEQPSPPKETPAEVKPAEAKPAEAPVEAKLAEVPAAEPVAEAAGKPTPPVSPAAEAPVVATAAAPAQAASAPAAEPPKEEIKEKTDKPEVPPTPPATPKSTPEPSTPVDEAPPAVEALLAAAPAAPGVPAVPATPATPAAPVSPAPVAKAPASPAAPATPAAPAVPAAPAAPATPATPAAPAVPTAPAAPVTPAAPASPAPAAEAPASPAAPAAATPEKTLDVTSASSDSPPLANTPSKDDAPVDPAAKSEERERRKKVEKLQLSPPAAADTLATPDSELEDAAALAHAIIASELAPSDPPAPTVAPAVSLAQIGVKPKGKSTAAQIESSVAPATPSAQAPAKPNAAAPSTPTAAAPATPSSEAPAKPSAATPATLSTKASAISVAVAPSTTSSKASATPRAAAPATPVADAPATPSAASPSFTRSSKAPATPSAAAPATPAAEASATPSAAAPATPSTPSSEAPATPTSEPSTPSAETPSTPTTAEATKEAPKKKVVKKVVKKEGDAPVPPPRKKEKKPKE